MKLEAAMLEMLIHSCPSKKEGDLELHIIETHCMTFHVTVHHPAPGDFRIIEMETQ